MEAHSPLLDRCTVPVPGTGPLLKGALEQKKKLKKLPLSVVLTGSKPTMQAGGQSFCVVAAAGHENSNPPHGYRRATTFSRLVFSSSSSSFGSMMHLVR